MIVRPAIRFIAIGLLAGLAGLAGAALADGPMRWPSPGDTAGSQP